ncbi:MAG: right-handed parallel beta-helix repeat-containing protein [Myxococcota bacterium]
MRVALPLLALAGCAACGSDRVTADAAPGDTAVDATPVDVVDAIDSDAVSDDADSADAAPSDDVTLRAAVAIPGKLVAVRVDAPEPRSDTVSIGATQVRLHRGRGVVTTRPEDAPELHLATRAWDAATDLRIDGERVVAAGETLTIAAGTRVLMGKDARLVVDGTLVAAGSEAAPILFTPDAEPWAAIEIHAGGKATLTDVWLVGGGADNDRFGGHSGSDPVVAAIGGEVAMSGGGIVDAAGKALYTEGATVGLDGVTIARCDTGGEHVESHVTMRHGFTFEIPDADGSFDDDDNDCIYLRLGTGVIEDSVFATGEDDAIDHNGAELEVRRVFIDGMHHEGIATSTGGAVTIEDATILHCNQGIEAGYGAPAVSVTRAFVSGCGVGFRWGDEYDWEALGTLTVDHSVALGNDVGVKTDDPQQGEAPVGAVAITCSAVATAAWDAVGGNIADVPAVDGVCPPALSACDATLGPASCAP